MFIIVFGGAQLEGARRECQHRQAAGQRGKERYLWEAFIGRSLGGVRKALLRRRTVLPAAGRALFNSQLTRGKREVRMLD